MFTNYLKTAWRNIIKAKGYSLINISGLAIGLTCCLLMMMWIQHELSFDHFHENRNQIYRVISKQETKGEIILNARTPDPLAPVLVEKFPEIINAIRYQGVFGWTIRCKDKIFRNDELGVADPTFFQMFSFPFISGNPGTALMRKNSIVITQSTAKKYFGSENPIGKVINITQDFNVTAVIEDIPKNSHLKFDLMIPIINMETFWHEDFTDWSRLAFYTYIQLKKGSVIKHTGQKIADTVKEHYINSNIRQLVLQPLKDIHLRSNHLQWDLDNSGKGNIHYVYIFTLTALCILLAACINFMNLSTARSGSRAKEIGIRKVMGAYRRDIISQYLGESILFSFIALVFAIFLTGLFLPVFNDLSGKELSMNFSGNALFIWGILGITLLTGLLSGSYPTLLFSSFQPVSILKGFPHQKSNRPAALRKILSIVQFSFTTLLLIAAMIIASQLKFMIDKDLGFKKDHIIFFHHRFGNNIEAVKHEMKQNPNILHITRSIPPTGKPWANTNFQWEGKKPGEKIVMYPIGVDENYLQTFGIKMAKGRFFSKEFPSDRSNYVLNETAVKTIGWQDPVGKRFSMEGRDGKIIGVIKNFHQSSLHGEIEPLVLSMQASSHICIRIAAHNVEDTLKFLQGVWQKYVSKDFPFTYTFLDNAINNFYKNERKTGVVFIYFTLLAAFIAFLGLYGLSYFAAAQRTREIGIRKVLGASAGKITLMLTRSVIKYILLANLIAWPLAYILMKRWLFGFSYRTDISPWIFVFSAFLVLLIALAAVSYQSLKAARINPAETLKYE